MSLAQLTAWCDARFGRYAPVADVHPRPYDVPWVIMDSLDAEGDFGCRPNVSLSAVLEEIANHAERHPERL